jgi:phosphoribosyl 1,2-cyclic phosphodiesterase
MYPEFLKARILSERGHLSNDACAAFIPHLAKNGTKRIILAHLSKDNNTQKLAFETNRKVLDDEGFSEVSLEIAKRSILDDET